MAACPTEAELQAALARAQGLAPFTPHLDSCASCSQVVARLVADSAALRSTTFRRVESPAAPPPGRRIGRYLLSDVLGSGAMGVVYLAQDTTLARPVALKLLRSADPDARAALLHEARSLARVTDPHVVAVYDVAEEGETLALAMEWVPGGTLADWLTQPRAWREVVGVLEGIARGLQSVHRNGLVHRDLKPANVLMDREGKPRVSDFGLVHLLPEALRAGIDTAGVAGIAGTPAYMAPEQLRGELVTPSADVYTFCAMAWEAVYGARHRTARTFDALVAGAGEAPPPSPRSELPRAVAALVRRGLSADPAARPPLEEFLRTFERALHPVRARASWFAAAVVLVAVPTAAWVQHRRAACSEVATAAQALRAAPHHAAQRAAFASSGAPYAATTFETANRLMTQWLEAWSTARVEVCEAHQRGELSAALLDGSMACLDDDLRAAAAIDDAWTHADLATVQRAVSSAAGLPALAGCRDRGALQFRQPLPQDPTLRAQVDVQRAVLLKARTELTAGKLAESGETLRAAMGALERTGYAPLMIEASYQLGRVEMERGKAAEAAKVFRKLIRDATAARDERAEVRAWIALGTLVTQFNLGTPDEQAEIVTYVEALASRAGIPRDVLDQLEDIRVSLKISRGDYGAALEIQRRLLERSRQYGPRHISTALALSNLGYVLNLLGRSSEAIAPLEESVAIRREQLGELHPSLGESFNNLASALHQHARYDEAAKAYRSALSVFEASLGRDHPNVATVTANLALIEEERGNFDEGLAMLDGAEAVYLARFGPEHASVARMTYYRAEIELRRGHWQAALDFAQAALPKYEKAFSPTHPKTATVRAIAAEAQLQLGQVDAAITLARRALDEHVAALKDNRDVEHDRRVLGAALLRAGKRDEGLRALETAAAWFEKDPSEKAELARCGLELGGPRRAAGCAFFAASPKAFPPEVAACEVAAWGP